MLDKKDLKDIKKLMQDALTDFFETLILPYFEHNEKDHAEIKATLKVYDKRFDDHEEMLKRLGKVENSSTKLPGKN